MLLVEAPTVAMPEEFEMCGAPTEKFSLTPPLFFFKSKSFGPGSKNGRARSMIARICFITSLTREQKNHCLSIIMR